MDKEILVLTTAKASLEGHFNLQTAVLATVCDMVIYAMSLISHKHEYYTQKEHIYEQRKYDIILYKLYR